MKHYLTLASTLLRMPMAFDGGLKAVYTSEEDIPEGVKDFYKKVGDQFELTVEISGVDGAKSFKDFKNLGEALRKERNDHKSVKATLGSLLGGRKPEEIQADLDRITELEAQVEAAGDKTKIEPIVEGRLKARLAPVERERDQLKTKLTAAENRIGELVTEQNTSSLHTQLRTIGTELKVTPEAIDDLILAGSNVFEKDESGSFVTRDKVGVTPGLGVKAWLEEIQPKKPHWFAQSAGGGAGGGGPRLGDRGPNPFSHDGWNMTAQGAMIKEDRAKAERMAKAAGTKIGGPRPAKK